MVLFITISYINGPLYLFVVIATCWCITAAPFRPFRNISTKVFCNINTNNQVKSIKEICNAKMPTKRRCNISAIANTDIYHRVCCFRNERNWKCTVRENLPILLGHKIRNSDRIVLHFSIRYCIFVSTVFKEMTIPLGNNWNSRQNADKCLCNVIH